MTTTSDDLDRLEREVTAEHTEYKELVARAVRVLASQQSEYPYTRVSRPGVWSDDWAHRAIGPKYGRVWPQEPVCEFRDEASYWLLVTFGLPRHLKQVWRQLEARLASAEPEYGPPVEVVRLDEHRQRIKHLMVNVLVRQPNCALMSAGGRERLANYARVQPRTLSALFWGTGTTLTSVMREEFEAAVTEAAAIRQQRAQAAG